MGRESFREKMAMTIFEKKYEVTFSTTPCMLAIAHKTAPSGEAEGYVKSSRNPLLMPMWDDAYILLHHGTARMLHGYDELAAIQAAYVVLAS
jgi:hypothetical protein